MMVKAMDSVAFENLVFALVRDDEPTARQLRPLTAAETPSSRPATTTMNWSDRRSTTRAGSTGICICPVAQEGAREALALRCDWRRPASKDNT